MSALHHQGLGCSSIKAVLELGSKRHKGGRNGTVSEAAPTSSPNYKHDRNNRAPPQKIAEAHKAESKDKEEAVASTREATATAAVRNMNQVSTLEDWLLASPCLNEGCTNGGDFKQFSSNRVYASLAAEHEDFTSKFRGSFSVERLVVNVDEVDRGGMEDSSLSRRQSGKAKKKVRFRLPEPADIIILDLSEE
ncbi:hypothetical protein F0562_010054 [Nyssa sinensis]|uniref:Uncharacterized protein n=1 Tax=Nyssa sinensis TaxID=561372 RepID=A0A5J5A2I1_9ASTE|nr:hypothetical protein F0562_010054 [Nyssa sinensis]